MNRLKKLFMLVKSNVRPSFAPSVGIVIPVYNRLENLKRCLRALECQTYTDFCVVIADDGSTDGTREYAEILRQTGFWRQRLTYVSGGPHRATRTGRARNLGAANLPSSVRLMVKTDSDILLAPNTLEQYWAYHCRYPRALLIGVVDWLPPLDLEEIDRALQEGGEEALRERIPVDFQTQRVEGTAVGRELRPMEYDDLGPGDPAPKPFKAKWGLPGNAAFPLDVFWELGGYDERMLGYGFQDIEFMMRAEQANAECLILSKIWSLHIWHSKADGAHLIEADRNLDYVIRKYRQPTAEHDPANWLEAFAAWHCWWHYNRDRGAQVVSVDGTLWAINRPRTYRIKLPSDRWLPSLLFTRDDVVPTLETELETIRPIGEAFEPLHDGINYLPPAPAREEVAQVIQPG